MIKNALLKSILFVLVFLPAVNVHANTCNLYFLVKEAAHGDQLSRELRSSPRLLKEGSFLFSGDDTTKEKVIAYLKQTFGKELNIRINQTVYDHIPTQFLTTASAVIYDSTENKCLISFPISDIRFKQDLVNYYLDLHKAFRQTTFRNKHVAGLTGCRNIDKAGQKLIINSAELKSRIYVFDLKTQAFDSLFIADNLLIKLYGQAGYKAEPKKLLQYLKEHDLARSVVSFYPNGYTDGYNYYSVADVFYYDPNDSTAVMLGSDTAYINTGKVIRYFVTYHTTEKELQLQEFDYWEVPLSENAFDQTPRKYQQDFSYNKQVNDSTWIASGSKTPEAGKEFSQTKLMFVFTLTKNATTGLNRWNCKGIYDSIYVDSITSYKGTSMEESNIATAFNYKPPYLYHNESPFIFNREINKLLNLTDYEKDINWTFDIQYTENLLHVIVQRYRKGIFQYTFNRSDYSLAGIQTVHADKDAAMKNIIDMLMEGENPDDLIYQSNILLDNGTIYFLHKNGEVVMYGK